MFTGESVISTNPEYVWGRRSPALLEMLQQAFPYSVGGYNCLAVTQKVIDAYSMFDGRSINSSSNEYPYSESGFTSQVETFSDYRLNSNVYNMYANREMRFYASIGFSECFWPLASTQAAGKYNQTISYTAEGNNSMYSGWDPHDYPPTGYVIKKFIHPMDALQGENARIMEKAFPIIRYAEILLSYAEALNNLGDNSYTVELDGVQQTFTRDIEEIRKAFNQVRHRAGLPGLTNELADAATVQQLIEKERMVEFLFENRRYYDVRRWGIYEQSESEPIMGMNTEGTKTSFYRRTIPNMSRIGARFVNKKLMFVPIPLAEVRRLPSLDQNPGWED
jgi:hypothetical protein